MNKTKIKEKIKSMKLVQPLIIYKRLKKDENLKHLMNLYSNGNLILYKMENEKVNSANNILHIKFDSYSSGFFACWLWGLMELSVADKIKMIPVIEWTSKSPYYEEEGVNGVKNPFEYYFEPVSNISIDNISNNANVFTTLNARGSTYTSYEKIGELVEVNKKYMKLKQNVNEKILKEIKGLIKNKKTLAVHVRGVEWGEISNHPIPLTLDKYIEEIDKAIEKEDFEQIFLATDSEDTIEFLSNKYKGKIVYYKDVARASKGSKTLAIFDNSIQRKNNHYLLGLEVLRDMMTLASCDGIIAGYSNISIAAEITKLSFDQKYLYKHIFKQEIQKKGITSTKAANKMKKGRFKGR